MQQDPSAAASAAVGVFARPTMEESRLKAILNAHLDDSIGLGEGRLAAFRREALRYYRGEPFGNEIEGRSQVVSRDLAHAVESLMPSLVKVFTAGDEVVKFEPVGPEDEAAAAQASDYVNHIWNRQNEGFRNFYAWFKDALLFRLGVVKIWWEERAESAQEAYEGLTETQLALLAADPEVRIVEARPSRVPPPPPALPELPPAPLFDVELRRTAKRARVRIAPLPPEEFAIASGATSLEDRPFCAHRTRRRIGDLVAMGHDRAALLRLAGAGALPGPEAAARREGQGPGAGLFAPAGDLDPSLREVTVTEAWLSVDWDGDGVAEYRRILAAGERAELILANEEADDNPFAALTPILMPHAFVGQSISDQCMDLQLIKSTLWRQMLDNLYLANNPEKEVVASEVNLDDLLTSRPGGLKRVRQPGMIRVLQTPFTAAASFPMLEYADGVLESRTGVTRYNQGLHADTLNRTATGINIISNAGQQRPELIARVFAETGVKRAFRLILRLVCRHQRQAEMVRLRNRWVEMDPRGWKDGMDLSVTVGLGTGSKEQKLGHLATIAAKQEQILQLAGLDNPLVSLGNYYNTLRRMVENADLKSPDLYFSDPSEAPPAPPPPPEPPEPGMVLAQARLGLEAEKLRFERERAAAELALEEARIGLERRRAGTGAART